MRSILPMALPRRGGAFDPEYGVGLWVDQIRWSLFAGAEWELNVKRSRLLPQMELSRKVRTLTPGRTAAKVERDAWRKQARNRHAISS